MIRIILVIVIVVTIIIIVIVTRSMDRDVNIILMVMITIIIIYHIQAVSLLNNAFIKQCFNSRQTWFGSFRVKFVGQTVYIFILWVIIGSLDLQRKYSIDSALHFTCMYGRLWGKVFSLYKISTKALHSNMMFSIYTKLFQVLQYLTVCSTCVSIIFISY